MRQIDQRHFADVLIHGEDERQVFVSLTPQGRRLLDKAPEITRCMIDGTGLAIDDLENIVTLLSALSANLSGDQSPNP